MDKKLTYEQRDALGTLYLRHMLGADERTINDFIEQPDSFSTTINARLSGIEAMKNDQHSFWQDVKPVLGEYYNDAIQRFNTYGGGMGPYLLLVAANPVNNRDGIIGRILYLKK